MQSVQERWRTFKLFITKTESDMNLLTVTSVKWPSLQRLVLTCSSAYTRDRCAPILQAILQAKELDMLPNLDEIFIIRGMVSVDPSKSANWLNLFFSASLRHFVPWFLNYSNFKYVDVRQEELKHILRTYCRSINTLLRFDVYEYFEFIINRLFQKMESKSLLPLSEASKPALFSEQQEILREVVTRFQIQFDIPELMASELLSFVDIFTKEAAESWTENVISHVRTYFDKIRPLVPDEVIDGIKIALEAAESVDWSGNDLSVFRE